jgi:hypothetical protein
MRTGPVVSPCATLTMYDFRLIGSLFKHIVEHHFPIFNHLDIIPFRVSQ